MPLSAVLDPAAVEPLDPHLHPDAILWGVYQACVTELRKSSFHAFADCCCPCIPEPRRWSRPWLCAPGAFYDQCTGNTTA